MSDQRVRIQVIGVYDVEVPDDVEDPIAYAYELQSSTIKDEGKLVDIRTDHAEQL